eukprot:SAG11_NODE_2160_length_3729_cov_23.704408_2_plen_296_part_00
MLSDWALVRGAAGVAAANGISEAGGVALATALESGQCGLTSLNLGGASALAAVWRSACARMRMVGGLLCACTGGGGGACVLSDLALVWGAAVCAAGNDIGEAGGVALATALESGQCGLTSLNLYSASALAAVWRWACAPMRMVGGLLCACTGGGGGACVLSDWALVRGAAVCAAGNDIGEAGGVALATALESGQCGLTSLNLYSASELSPVWRWACAPGRMVGGFALCVHWARRRRVRAERLGVGAGGGWGCGRERHRCRDQKTGVCRPQPLCRGTSARGTVSSRVCQGRFFAPW